MTRVVLFALALFVAPAVAQPTTAFTYQGSLSDGGSPANGSYDFVFYFFEGEIPTGPFEVISGGPVNHPGVIVTDGVFELVLDPGLATINDYDTHYLSIQVRVAGAPSYTTLAPRQRLYPVALATRAVLADNAGELDLPFAGTGQNVASPLFWLTNTSDNGGAGIRMDVTGLSGGNAIEAITTEGNAVEAITSMGTAVYAESGDGPAGEFTNLGPDDRTVPTLHAHHARPRGPVGLFESDLDNFSGAVVLATVRSDAALTYALHGVLRQVIVTTGPSELSAAVRGENISFGDNGYGVWGSHDRRGVGVYGSAVSGGTGVKGEAVAQNFAVGVRGVATSATSKGVWGTAKGESSAGIWGDGSDGALAGFFVGDVTVTGTLSKGGGTFKIDHPQDPENRYLSHSFVESPEMMNVYNGVIALDEDGCATVELPGYFGALNKDFRYQLTCLGGFAPVYIEREVAENEFAIAGGTAGLRVSWQVTGVRTDPFAMSNPVIVEEEKSDAHKGRYLHPEAYGLSREEGVWSVEAKGDEEH